MRQRLLRKASYAISPGALAALCFYDHPKLLFGTFKPLSGCAAPLAVRQRLLRKASYAISPSETAFWHPQTLVRLRSAAFWHLQTLVRLRSASSSASETATQGLSGHLTWCLGHSAQRLPSHLVPWPHSVFVNVRNCFLAPSAAQRLQQCVRDCFGRPLTPSHLVPWPHSVFTNLRTSETAFWHPQTLVRLRSASSSASETASEGLSRHLTWCLGRTLFLCKAAQRLYQCLTKRLRKASQGISPGALAPLYFYDRPKLLNLLCTRLLVPSHLLALPPRCAFCFAGDYFACQLCCAHGHPAAVLCLTRIRPELCEDNTVVWHSGHLCRYCRVPPQTTPSFTCRRPYDDLLAQSSLCWPRGLHRKDICKRTLSTRRRWQCHPSHKTVCRRSRDDLLAQSSQC